MFVEQLPSGKFRGGYRHDGRKHTRTFDYRYEAEAWAAAAEAEANAPAAPAPAAPAADPGPVFDTYAAEWLTRLGHLTRATRDSYASHLRAITRSGMGARRMGEVRRSDVQRWLTSMAEDGAGRPTINARLKVLRMVFRDAVVEHVVPFDPTAGVPLLTLDLTTDRVITPDEETRLMVATAAAPWLRAMVLLGLDAGLRWQEAAALPADSVVGDYLIIRQVVEKSGPIRGYPKGHRSRVVPMTTRLAAALAPLVAEAEARGRDALLFPNRDGGPMDYYNWRRRAWRPLCREAALTPRPRFHDLRHTYGSRLAAASVPRSEVATIMGHADEATTARYIHTGDDGRRLSLVREALTPAPVLTPVADTTA